MPSEKFTLSFITPHRALLIIRDKIKNFLPEHHISTLPPLKARGNFRVLVKSFSRGEIWEMSMMINYANQRDIYLKAGREVKTSYRTGSVLVLIKLRKNSPFCFLY